MKESNDEVPIPVGAALMTKRLLRGQPEGTFEIIKEYVCPINGEMVWVVWKNAQIS